MGKTITPVSRANHTAVDIETIEGFDAFVASHPDVVAATAERHAEDHIIPSHTDTTESGTQLDTLTSGEDTTLHKHQIDVIDGGDEF